MADYVWNVQYSAVQVSIPLVGVGLELGSGDFSGGTATDENGSDTQFTENESITLDPDSGITTSGDFLGTYVSNGQTLLVFQTGLLTYQVVGQVPDGYTPDSDPIPLDDLTTSAFTTCFAAGTLIATPEGESAVETLRPGDLVVCADGTAVPVRWVGRQSVHQAFVPAERMRPVRIRAGALGGNLPHADLTVTADHGMIVDGYVVNASVLVGAPGIEYVPMEEIGPRVTYYHVETPGHRVILANGAPAETYIDYVARKVFDNYDEYIDLCGEDVLIEEMEQPRVSSLRQLPRPLRERFGLVEEPLVFPAAAA